ncbi:cytochrome P450 [Podospora australis]|uniref:Cytochrome P450 n=1 Tax=Podospora australis TaxID=1536484 RepID=A0AAN7AHK5_9PEZI|nr:cytochrome P450 [Podospora australis]
MTTFLTDRAHDLLALAPAWAWAVGLLVTWYVVSAVTTWYRLRHIPGPFFARFSYLYIGYHTFKGDSARVYSRFFENYGSLVRVGPNYVVTSDPKLLNHINGARSPYQKDGWYRGSRFLAEYDNMGSLLDVAEHDRIKAKTASGYNGRENGADMEPAIDEQIGALVDLIRRKYISKSDQQTPVDISQLFRYFTMDVITRLGYSKSFGHLAEGTDVYGWCANVDGALTLMSCILDFPLLRDILFSKNGLALVGPKPTDKAGLGRVLGIVHNLVSERLKQAETDGKLRGDMINGFIRNGLTQQEIEGEAVLHLIAGSDTTTNVLAGTMSYLMATPHVYARLKREIQHAIESGLVSADKPIRYDQAQKLPYLQGVIWEGYRIRPPLTIGHYKVVPPGGDTLNGVFLPEGTAIGHNTLALTRNKEIFGEDVEYFRPERFSEVDEATRIRRFKALDITFGAGRYACAGKQVALYELNKCIFELMRNFDFQLTSPGKGWKEAHSVQPKYTGMMTRFTEADWVFNKGNPAAKEQ